MIKGGDQFGNCRTIQTGNAKMTDFGDPTVNFGTDLIYGCGVSLNYAGFVDYCTNS
jgi:hypothetical protein